MAPQIQYGIENRSRWALKQRFWTHVIAESLWEKSFPCAWVFKDSRVHITKESFDYCSFNARCPECKCCLIGHIPSKPAPDDNFVIVNVRIDGDWKTVSHKRVRQLSGEKGRIFKIVAQTGQAHQN